MGLQEKISTDRTESEAKIPVLLFLYSLQWELVYGAAAWQR
jgi:hypothetical protein